MNAQVRETIDEPRTDTRRNWPAEEHPVGIYPGRIVENKSVLERDDIALHPLNLSHMSDSSRAIAETGNLDDEIHCGRELLADCPQGEVHSSHKNQRFKSGHSVTGRIGVHS